MLKNRLFIIIPAFLLFSFNIVAQDKPAPKPEISYHFFPSSNAEADKFYALDTSLKNIQRYNPVYSTAPFTATLGNTGSPYRNLFFSSAKNLGFQYGINTYDNLFLSPDNLAFYQVNRPFSDLSYVMGAKKEQILNIKHYQSVKQNLILGLQFRIINSPGYYKYQKTNNTSFTVSGSYFTDNQRYKMMAMYRANRIKIRENGGIASDSTFENNLETDREVYLTRLTGAESHYRESGISLQQSLYLGRLPQKKASDTTQMKGEMPKPQVADSIFVKEIQDESGKERKPFCWGTIRHRIDYQRQSSVYLDTDPTSGFYSNIYADSTETQDSIHIDQISNELLWTNQSPLISDSTRLFRLYFGVRNQYSVFSDAIGEKYFTQMIPRAGFIFHPVKTTELRVNTSYVQGTYNDGDYQMDASLNNGFGKNRQFKLVFTVSYTQAMPAWFYSFYRSNNFYWIKNLKQQQVSKAGAMLSWKGYTIGTNYYVLSNYTFLDEEALPAQDNTTLKVLQMYIKKDFTLNGIHSDNHFVWQKINGSDELRLPEIMLNSSLYYQMALFKKVLLLQVGVDASYNSSYYADAYMPALHSFYLQKEKKIGDYWYGDVFINFQVKRANLFVKYQHFNSWFGDYSYYGTLHYPMPDAGFRFGVNWRFYD